MFNDQTNYAEVGPREWAVMIGTQVVDSGLTYAAALKLAQRTKGSRVSPTCPKCGMAAHAPDQFCNVEGGRV